MNKSSSSSKHDIPNSANLFENLLLQAFDHHGAIQHDQQSLLQGQVNIMLGLMRACIEQPLIQASLPAAQAQHALAAFHTLEPLLMHMSTMLNLLVRAGMEINGNPFLDEDTTLHEIKQFLRLNEVMVMLPQVIYNLEPEQVEIAEDLLDLDPEDNMVGGGFFPASEIRKSAAFPLSELVGNQGQAACGTEWEWVRRNSGLAQPADNSTRIGGFVLDLGLNLADAPARLQPMLAEARQKGLGYLIFY